MKFDEVLKLLFNRPERFLLEHQRCFMLKEMSDSATEEQTHHKTTLTVKQDEVLSKYFKALFEGTKASRSEHKVNDEIIPKRQKYPKDKEQVSILEGTKRLDTSE